MKHIKTWGYTCTLLLINALQVFSQHSMITEHGYRFLNHTTLSAPRPIPGEGVLTKVSVWAGTTLLSSSAQNPGGTYRFDIPKLEEKTGKNAPPIEDAVLQMAKGDSATIWQPIDSFMRQFLPPSAVNEKEIRFEIVLLDIISLEAKAKAAAAAKVVADRITAVVQQTATAFRNGQLNDKIRTLPSGLKILVEDPGKGKKIVEGEPLQVHYCGVLQIDGRLFDNSWERRQPLGFAAGAGQMISGFDEGVMQLNHGARAYLFVPHALAYGDGEAAEGLIPPKSDLVFYIDIL